jgi:hypothetical protein
MKKRKIKKLAEAIAAQELIIQNSENELEIIEAQSEVIRLITENIKCIEDIDALDDAIQKILSQS